MNTKRHAELIRDQVQHFSDSDFQIRVWIKGLGPEVSSPDEAYSMLFDSFEAEEFCREVSLPEKLRSDLKAFLEHLDSFSSQELQDAAHLIQDPRWKTVRLAASTVLQELNNFIRDLE
jgi:hypothetical protein